MNTKDNTKYHSEVIKLVDSAGRLALDHPLASAKVFDKAVELQKLLIEFRDKVKAYEDSRQYQKAIDETLLAINKIPDFADGYYKLGVLYSKADQKQQSDMAFDAARKLYEQKLREADTDRNRHLNYLNLLKIDIYTEKAQNTRQKVQELSRSFATVDTTGLPGLTKAELLNRTELAVN